MTRKKHTLGHRISDYPILVAVFLTSLAGTAAFAQDEDATCPCFSYEEAEAIYLNGEKFEAEGGTSDCSAQDYDVECNAELVVWDQDYATVAQASVNWYDFDPSRCSYVDSIGNPGVERNVTWPHPAPEDLARACFDIITRVIAKADTSGKCNTYP